jgi:hypothetical protein
MNIFNEHPSTVGENWWQHFRFTVGVACKLLIASVFWMLHGLFPFIPIPLSFNLGNLGIKLGQENFYRNQKKNDIHKGESK